MYHLVSLFTGAKCVSRSDEFSVAEKDEKDFAKTCI